MYSFYSINFIWMTRSGQPYYKHFILLIEFSKSQRVKMTERKITRIIALNCVCVYICWRKTTKRTSWRVEKRQSINANMRDCYTVFSTSTFYEPPLQTVEQQVLYMPREQTGIPSAQFSCPCGVLFVFIMLSIWIISLFPQIKRAPYFNSKLIIMPCSADT